MTRCQEIIRASGRLLAVAVALAFTFMFTYLAASSYGRAAYVRGLEGRYCYPMRSVPATVSSPVSFGSLDECLRSVGKI